MTVALTDQGQRPLRLLLSVLADDQSALVRTIGAMSSADWEQFLHLVVERHRVVPAIAAKLETLTPPKPVANALKSAAQTVGLQTLDQMAALRAINDAFAQQSLRFVVLKGWPLAERLFGSPGARMVRDLDLLVSPEQVPEASEALGALGYQACPEHPEQHRLIGTAALTEEVNNISFTDTRSGQLVELHWRSHQFRGWPELFEDASHIERYESSIGAVWMPTDQANLIYLCIHGSMHRWARLKWLLDIATIAKQRGALQLQDDLDVARENGAARPVALGLCLSSHLLNAPRPENGLTSGDWLPQQCIHEIIRPEAIPTGVRQRLKFYAMMLAMADGTSQRLGVLRYRLWGKNRLSLADLRRAA